MKVPIFTTAVGERGIKMCWLIFLGTPVFVLFLIYLYAAMTKSYKDFQSNNEKYSRLGGGPGSK